MSDPVPSDPTAKDEPAKDASAGAPAPAESGAAEGQDGAVDSGVSAAPSDHADNAEDAPAEEPAKHAPEQTIDVHSDQDADTTVDVTPEEKAEADAGVEPAPVVPEEQHDQVLDYSQTAEVATPESGNVAGQEQPAAPDRAPLVPELDKREDATDPTATVQQADHPLLSVLAKDDASVADLVEALDAEWSYLKQAHWNVPADNLDHLVAALKAKVGVEDHK